MIHDSELYTYFSVIKYVLFFFLGVACGELLYLAWTLCKVWYDQRRRVVHDIETGRRPPTRPPATTHVIRHVVTALRQVNPDREAAAEHNGSLGEVLKEQIFDSNTCKNNDCVICIDEFKEKETIRVVVSCQHSFHAHCINQWLLIDRSCPICRRPIAS